MLATIIPLLLCGTVVFGAAKPAQKKPAASGTVQLAGDNGIFGTVYSLGKDNPIYFRLKSAEFTVDQVVVGNNIYVPRADEKLIVLHFTIQNPQKTEQFVRWDTLRFTAVDAMNTNHEGDELWGDERNHSEMSMMLKPAQTVEAYTCFAVPAKGIIPKLMVLPPVEGDKILRYDLTNPKNKVSALKAPFADPSDSSGYTALETVQGSMNVMYPYNNFDISVEKFEYTTNKLDKEEALEEGTRHLVVTLQTRSESPENAQLRWDTITPVLTSTDGEELEYNNMLLAAANRPIDKIAKCGEENRVRIYFTVPKGVTPKTLTIKEGDDNRSYEFKVQAISEI
jgi:hypothetical protein